ncbi:MAG TPA: ribonuclease P protein component [Candidatus Methylomirabilis sp.]|nr:ribonuclease P protein component [Candidatus Methylomirabilis sp.]
MLSRVNRLTRKKDFDAVWQKGRSSYDKIIGTKALANGLKVNRFGILVGLKFSKKAVERNKIKRRLREIIRAQAENFKTGFDVVITVLPLARGAEFAELRKSLIYNLKRLGIYRVTRSS